MALLFLLLMVVGLPLAAVLIVMDLLYVLHRDWSYHRFRIGYTAIITLLALLLLISGKASNEGGDISSMVIALIVFNAMFTALILLIAPHAIGSPEHHTLRSIRYWFHYRSSGLRDADSLWKTGSYSQALQGYFRTGSVAKIDSGLETLLPRWEIVKAIRETSHVLLTLRNTALVAINSGTPAKLVDPFSTTAAEAANSLWLCVENLTGVWRQLNPRGNTTGLSLAYPPEFLRKRLDKETSDILSMQNSARIANETLVELTLVGRWNENLFERDNRIATTLRILSENAQELLAQYDDLEC